MIQLGSYTLLAIWFGIYFYIFNVALNVTANATNNKHSFPTKVFQKEKRQLVKSLNLNIKIIINARKEDTIEN